MATSSVVFISARIDSISALIMLIGLHKKNKNKKKIKKYEEGNCRLSVVYVQKDGTKLLVIIW